MQIYFLKSGKYLASKKTAKLIVKAEITKDNGYWIRLDESLSTDFKKLYKTGTKHVFILSSAFNKFGEKKVLNWIKKAHAYGIKVHVWMCCFNHNGKFIAPSYKNGKININRMVFLFKKIKRFASFKLVNGIHFDYLRYPGTAHKYKNGIKAINYFVKTAVKIIRTKNPRIIISAAIMPEPSMMKYYYGQDMSTHPDI